MILNIACQFHTTVPLPHNINHIPYVLHISYRGRGIAPLSKIPENGWLGTKLKIYDESGKKLEKNPKQLHTKS